MNNDKWDKYAKRLENKIRKKSIKDYNEYIVDLFYEPKNWGKLSNEELSISQSYKGPCGDTMEFYLKIQNGIIEKATFITDGCGASVATASQVTLLIEGKSLNYAEALTPDEIDNSLGGLPENHKHCALLAAKTLKKAIIRYIEKVKE